MKFYTTLIYKDKPPTWGTHVTESYNEAAQIFTAYSKHVENEESGYTKVVWVMVDTDKHLSEIIDTTVLKPKAPIVTYNYDPFKEPA